MHVMQAEDTLLHFQWWDRTTCTLEDVFMLCIKVVVLNAIQ